MTAAASPQAPLNVFQKVILQWEHVHPYNGAQVMTLASAPGAQQVEAAWNDALRALGLGALHLGAGAYHYNARSAARQQPVASIDSRNGLEAHLSEELNRPFDEGNPFRPFIHRHDDGGGCDLGIVYRHLAADSVSIRMLMREWFTRLFDPPQQRTWPVAMPRHGYWPYLGPARGGWDIADGLLGAPRTFSRFRKVRRLHTGGSTDYRTSFLHRPAPTGLARALRSAAARRGATVNDLFLASAVVACRDHLPFRNVPRRTSLAVGSIVDLRPYSTADLSDTFGLFLGFANVFCSPSDLRNIERLVRSIAAQTRRHKATHAPASGIVWMYASLLSRRLVRDERAYQFHRKHMPLAGGVSNVCLDRTWASRYHPSPLTSYMRVSPTGPMVPLAFTPTTLDREMNLGLTYRSAILTRPVADAMAGQFLDQLARLI